SLHERGCRLDRRGNRLDSKQWLAQLAAQSSLAVQTALSTTNAANVPGNPSWVPHPGALSAPGQDRGHGTDALRDYASLTYSNLGWATGWYGGVGSYIYSSVYWAKQLGQRPRLPFRNPELSLR